MSNLGGVDDGSLGSGDSASDPARSGDMYGQTPTPVGRAREARATATRVPWEAAPATSFTARASAAGSWTADKTPIPSDCPELPMRDVPKLVSVTDGSTTPIHHGQSLAIGRSDTADIPVFDYTVSRRHARLELTSRGIELHDTSSRNGTYVNGTRVENAILVHGDIVMFGKVAFEIRSDGRATA